VAISRFDRDGMRQGNLAAVLGRLHRDGPATRSELTATSGLSRSTVGELVRHLTQQGLVEERRGPSAGQRGRPSPVVAPRPERVVVLAVDIQVETVAVATYGLGGELLALERTAQAADPGEPEHVVAAVAPLLARQRAALRPDQHLLGIGVAIAGVVRASDGFVHLCPNLGWRDAELGALLTDALGVPAVPVVVGNEADLAALAEWRRGAGRGARDLLYLFAEVGVGSGIIVDGRPLTGADGYAGEVGHLPINPAGSRCRCGGVGCWETEVANGALVRRAAERGLPARSGRAVLGAAAEGDEHARGAVEDTAAWLGLGLAGLVNVLNPRRVVLGGLLGEVARLAEPSLRTSFADHALGCAGAAVELVPGSLGDRAQLTGAAERVFTLLLEDPGLVPALLRAPEELDLPSTASAGS
jgi:predicted NBD/HSP70 family sugar kinase